MYLSRAILAMLAVREVYSVSQETIDATLSNTPPDTFLTFTQLASEYGHSGETHYVTTEDGYILALDHIPGDQTRPVLCNHGVFDTSDGWIIQGNNSLAIKMADAGYDVWAMNIRGNRYSRNHTTLDPNKEPFWDYTLTELAKFDLAACINYVLNHTGQKQLSIIGFSQGTTLTFILTAIEPSYNEKIKVFIALAPIVYLHNAKPLLSLIIKFSQFLNWILPPNFVEFAGYYSLTKAVINLLCTQTVISYDLCYSGGFNSVSGPDVQGILRQFFPTVIGHFPAGAGRKSLLHFAQIGLRKTLAYYDYGTVENVRKYLSITPPEYDLRKVTIPVKLVSGRTDTVSTLEDVDILKNKLINVETMLVNRIEWNHLDHMWADRAHEIEYPYVIEKLNKYH